MGEIKSSFSKGISKEEESFRGNERAAHNDDRNGVRPQRRKETSTHTVDIGFVQRAQLARKINVYVEVQIAIILRVGLHPEIAEDLFVPLHC